MQNAFHICLQLNIWLMCKKNYTILENILNQIVNYVQIIQSSPFTDLSPWDIHHKLEYFYSSLYIALTQTLVLLLYISKILWPPICFYFIRKLEECWQVFIFHSGKRIIYLTKVEGEIMVLIWQWLFNQT